MLTRRVTVLVVLACAWLLAGTAAPAGAIEWPWKKKLPTTGEAGQNINVQDATGKPQGWRGDGNGVGMVTEAYPREYQYGEPFITVSATLGSTQASATNPLNGTGLTPYSASSINLVKSATIKVTGGTTNTPWSVRFYGSDDGSTWAPIMASLPAFGQVWGTSTAGAADTLKVVHRGVTGTNGFTVQLSDRLGNPINYKHIAAVGAHDSTDANIVMTVTLRGRMF